MMRAILSLLILAGTPAGAGPFDGLYRSDGAVSWDCSLIGSDGGAILIKDDVFHGVESLCNLTNPVEVNGMSAVLYDADCNGEGMTYGYRMMLMRVPEGLAVVTDGYVDLLRACQ